MVGVDEDGPALPEPRQALPQLARHPVVGPLHVRQLLARRHQLQVRRDLGVRLARRDGVVEHVRPRVPLEGGEQALRPPVRARGHLHEGLLPRAGRQDLLAVRAAHEQRRDVRVQAQVDHQHRLLRPGLRVRAGQLEQHRALAAAALVVREGEHVPRRARGGARPRPVRARGPARAEHAEHVVAAAAGEVLARPLLARPSCSPRTAAAPLRHFSELSVPYPPLSPPPPRGGCGRFWGSGRPAQV